MTIFLGIVLDPFWEDDRMIYFINTTIIYLEWRKPTPRIFRSAFFPNENKRARLFREGSRLPFRLPPSSCPPFYRVFPRRHLPCQKLFPLEIYRFGENRGVISWRTKQRERIGWSRSSKNNWRPLLSLSSLIRPA